MTNYAHDAICKSFFGKVYLLFNILEQTSEPSRWNDYKKAEQFAVREVEKNNKASFVLILGIGERTDYVIINQNYVSKRKVTDYCPFGYPLGFFEHYGMHGSCSIPCSVFDWPVYEICGKLMETNYQNGVFCDCDKCKYEQIWDD